jgi:hypothetical protein
MLAFATLLHASPVGTPPARAATITVVSCTGPVVITPTPGAAASRLCTYRPAPGYHATHDGGPWVNVDLLHDTAAALSALHDGTSNRTLYPGGPALPALGLVHAQICLSDPQVAYNACPNNYPDNPGNPSHSYQLNPAIIPMLQQGFDNLRQAGLKVVLRFTYNWPGSSAAGTRSATAEPQDAPLNVILTHMRDLAPVIQANSDVIFALQAGFIGRWGEWHNATNAENGLQASHNAFLDQYTALFQPYTRLEVRYPYILLDYATYRHGASIASLGIGMHNDEFGSDESDGGTFLPEQAVNNPNPTPYDHCLLFKTTQAAAKLFTMTGETIQPYDFTGPWPCDSNNPLTYQQNAAFFALTTLQFGGFPAVFQNWVQTGQFTTIEQSIGPHLQLLSAALAAGSQSLTLTLQNTGWAAMSGTRPLWLLLQQNGQTAARLWVPINLASIAPGTTATATVPLTLPASLSGNYALQLSAPDPAPRLGFDPRYALLFENLGMADATTGLNPLGVIHIAP